MHAECPYNAPMHYADRVNYAQAYLQEKAHTQIHGYIYKRNKQTHMHTYMHSRSRMHMHINNNLIIS